MLVIWKPAHFRRTQQESDKKQRDKSGRRKHCALIAPCSELKWRCSLIFKCYFPHRCHLLVRLCIVRRHAVSAENRRGIIHPPNSHFVIHKIFASEGTLDFQVHITQGLVNFLDCAFMGRAQKACKIQFCCAFWCQALPVATGKETLPLHSILSYFS